MTEFAGQTFQELCTEADARLHINDRELTRDIISRATQAYNELEIPGFPDGKWLVHCVGSRLLKGEVGRDTDDVRLEGDTVRRMRTYAPLEADVYYAALTEEHDENSDN